jgi:hypothetical protein
MEIYKECDSLYILNRNHKKLVIRVFMAIFVSYCPLFWDSKVIYKAHDNQGHFHELLPTVLEFGGIYKAHDTQYMFERLDKKTHHFCILGPLL